MAETEELLIAGQTAVPVNPYVGPRSFRVGEQIFGRDRERRDLGELLTARRILLLYSPSGAGKTSLIEAGLRLDLENDGFVVLPTIRLSHDVSDDTPNRYRSSMMLSLEDALPADKRLAHDEMFELSLLDYFERLRGELDPERDPCLVLDQFEELFTVDPVDHVAKKEFVAGLGDLLNDRGLWALFSMREDFLAQFEPHRPLLPNGIGATYRLGLLEPAAARRAVAQPAAQAGVEFSESATTKLVDDLRTVRVNRGSENVDELGPTVEPVQLQVVCYQLWEKLEPGAVAIDEAHLQNIGSVAQALSSYVDSRLQLAADRTGVDEGKIRSWIEQDLITANGFRAQTTEGPGDDGAEVLSILEAAHLIRGEHHRGTQWYELAHDTLIAPVKSSNERWREKNRDLLSIRAQTWEEEGRSNDLLLRGSSLKRAQRSASDGAELDALEAAYIESSVRRHRRVAQRLIMAVTLAVTFLGAGLGLATYLYQQQGAALEAEQELHDDLAAVVGQEGLLLGHTDAVSSLGWSPDGTLLATGSWDHTVRLWDPSSGLPVGESIVGEDLFFAVDWSPDGTLLATASFDRAVRFWDPSSREVVGELVGNPGGIVSLAWSPDGSLLASASLDRTVGLWDPHSGQNVGRFIGHTSGVLSVAWSPDGTLLASASSDETVNLWDARTGDLVGTLTGHTGPVLSVAWSPDGTLLASAGEDRTIRLWQPDSQRLVSTLTGHTGPVQSVAWSPDGTLLASAGEDGTIRLWQPDSQRLVSTLTGHTGPVQSVAWSPDGTILASAGEDGTARLHDVSAIR